MNRLTLRSLPHPRRRGTTLTEVLMSLMIMSIGVVSLATLFPIAATRVLEATNLTNATVLKYNAEGIIDSFPAIIHEPDGTTIDPVTSQRTREAGRAIQVDPLGFWERYQQLDAFDDGTINGSPSVTDQQLVYYEYNRPTPLLSLPYRQNPAGSLLTTRFLGEDPTATNIFGSIDIARAIATLPDTSVDFGEGFPDPTGSNPGVYTLNAENRITGVLLPVEINLSPLTLATTDPNYQSPTLYQAVIFDKSGDYSEIRQLTSVTQMGSQYQISWGQDLNGDGSFQAGEDLPLPLRYTADSAALPNVGRVRIEQPVSNYTWMLTVRKQSSGPANVDVVVFNKRDFSELSDQVYVCDLRRYTLGPDDAPGQAGVDDNFNGVTDEIAEIGYPRNPPTNLSDDEPNFRAVVDWTPSHGFPVTPLEPPLRKGGYIYDTANGLWYRIRDIEEPTIHPLDPSLGPLPDTSAAIVLEDSISRDNTEDRNGNGMLDTGEDVNGNSTLDRGGVIIPSGVVAVFPLETKVP